MNEKIEVDFQYSVEDFVRGCVFTQNKNSFFYKYNSWITGLISTVSFAIFYSVFIKAENEWSVSDLSMLIFGLMIAFPVAFALKNSYSFTKKSLRKQYESSPLLRENQKIFFSLDGIESESVSLTNKINWNAIIETDETDEDFFFFTSPNMALFVPKRVFSVEQQNEIRNLAKIKLGEKAKF